MTPEQIEKIREIQNRIDDERDEIAKRQGRTVEDNDPHPTALYYVLLVMASQTSNQILKIHYA